MGQTKTIPHMWIIMNSIHTNICIEHVILFTHIYILRNDIICVLIKY